jgi:hypothetical protein
MNSKEIKTKLLHYWRFRRRYIYCATEVGKFKADILVSNGEEILEIEVKVSRGDIVQEKKKKKHFIYHNPSTWYSQFVPNKFYIAVPKNLVPIVTDLTINKNYGIVQVKKKQITKNRKEVYCKIIKQAKIIYPKFNEKLHRQIIMRMGSELIRMRMKL